MLRKSKKEQLKKNRLRTYIVWLSNHTDRRDDEPTRVKARTREEAMNKALEKAYGGSSRFSVRDVYILPTFYKLYPGWKGLI